MTNRRGRVAVAVAGALPALAIAAGCSQATGPAPAAAPTATATSAAAAPTVSAPVSGTASAPACGASASQHPLAVHFYNVGQALSALVTLPDGRHVLVDSGDAPHRAGCSACEGEHQRLVSSVTRDLAGAPLDLVWITHPHSDHVGGAADLLTHFDVKTYIDNGRGGDHPEVARARSAAGARGAAVLTLEPINAADPASSALAALRALSASDGSVILRAVVPPSWPRACDHDENECSIALRIDDCASSVLFTGDAERDEEAHLDALGPVTLLQVGHHGSDTSSSPRFLAALKPHYAVISAGAPDDDRNREYCHPRAVAVRRLSDAIQATGTAHTASEAPLHAFDGKKCGHGEGGTDWTDLSVSSALYATERDGDITLVTTGDGVFTRR